MLKRDRFFVVSARDGSINPGEFHGDGVWDGDTRILSRLRLLINGVEPAYGGANYRRAIRGYVGVLEDAGINPVLDLHWSAPGTELAVSGEHPVTLARVTAFPLV